MATLSKLQKPFELEEEKIVKELEKDIQKDTQKIRDEILVIATFYNDKYSGGAIPSKEQKEMNKKISKKSLLLAALIGDKIYKSGRKNIDNKYLGTVYSYAKVSNSVVNYKWLTEKEARLTILDKIQGKTYVKRLNIHSKTLSNTTGAIIKNGIRLGFSDEQIARNITKRMGVNYNQSLTIARAEVARIGSQMEEKAAKEALKQGFIFTKTWKHFASPGEREEHIQMNNVTVNGGDLFTLPNGETCPRPRIGLSGGQTINCRCQAVEKYVGRKEGYVKASIGTFKKWLTSEVGR